MSVPLSIWERTDVNGEPYIYETRGATGEFRRVFVEGADKLRLAKHLSDAETAAEYWKSWPANGPSHKKTRTLQRFALHEQAI